MQNTDITFTPLGGGREIGANSYLLQWGDANIILDSGLNPRRTGFDALPAFDLLQEKEVQAVIISHAHLDHIGSLPFLVENYMGLGANIFLTPPTARLVPLMSMESVKQIERGRIPMEDMFYYHLYMKREIVDALKKNFSAWDYGTAFEIVPGLTGSFFPVGHILGAAGVTITDGDYTVVYTGDISLKNQKLLEGAQLPENVRPDCLIIESTYGNNPTAQDIDPDKEFKQFGNEIRKCLKRKGHVLIPCFALGRAQELVWMIAQLKAEKIIPEKTPIFVHRGSTEGVNRIYDASVDFLPGLEKTKIAELCRPVNLYKQKKGFYKAADLTSEPSIFVFTSGMMARGTPSAKLAEELIDNTRNAILFTGYVAPNELGYQLVNSRYGQSICLDIENQYWKKVKNRHIHKFSFSAHAHRKELAEIQKFFQPDLTLWVHGDEPSTRWMSKNRPETDDRSDLAPDNRVSVLLRLGSEKINNPFSHFRAVIVTVGTSLIISYFKKNGIKDRKPDTVTRDELVAHIQDSQNPAEICAETNSLARKAIRKDDFLYFICGDSPAGHLCGEILSELYEQTGFRCRLVSIKGLRPDAKAFHDNGMNLLIYELVGIIEKHDANAIIHATGGFKAQIALATLIGILFKLKVYYIYEDFTDVIKLPEIPLDYSYETLTAFRKEFFNLLGARKHWQCDQEYAKLPEMLRHCFIKNRIQHRYTLTPLGRAMFKAFQRQVGMRLSEIPITVKGETSLWGDEKDAVGKILNPMIGIIMERISRYHDIILGFDFTSVEISTKKRRRKKENYLELMNQGSNFLRYRVDHMGSVSGRQDRLKIRVAEGMAPYLLHHIGRKIYP